MIAKELNEVQIKLINIIQDHYIKPLQTDGKNILKSTHEIFQQLQGYWKSEDYQSTDVEICLQYLQFDFIKRAAGEIAWFILLAL